MVRTVEPYRTYTFYKKDPIIAKLKKLIDEQGVGFEEICEASGVRAGTLRSWIHGKTKRPQFATAAAVAGALQHELQLIRRT